MDKPSLTNSQLRAELERRFGANWLEWAERWGPSQRRILESEKMYLFALGGNGAGKSQMGGWWTAGQLHSFDPIKMRAIPRQHVVKGYAVAPTTEKIEQVMKPSLEQWFEPGMILHRGTKTNDCWTFKNGARLLWKTGNQDPQTYTGDEIDFAWIDEEIETEAHWKGVQSRGFRRLARYLCTMTAERGTLWFHSWIFSPDEYPMEHKEIVSIDTRENPYYSDCDRCSKPERWHEPERQRGACAQFDNSRGKQKLEIRIRQCKGEADFKVRIKGEYLTGAGVAVIDPVRRMEMEQLYRRDPMSGYLNEELKFVRIADQYDSRAWLRIEIAERSTLAGHRQRVLLTPVRGRQYVIGVDAAEGNPVGDWHSAVVIETESGEQCALALSRSVPARHFGAYIVQLAKYYNDAYVVVEANNHGGSVIDTLQAMGYGNVYRRQRWDAIAKKPMPRIGFWTDPKSKKPAVDLMAMFFETKIKVHDPVIFAEAYSYCWLKENRTGSHGVGCSNPSGHDDTMTALFCASVGLRQMGWAVIRPEDAPTKSFEPTMADALMEDATGQAISEEEALERVAEQSREMGSIGDVFSDGTPEEWIP